MDARWTGSGSVPRIDKDQGNACYLGFVVYKHPEQSEIPCMQIATLCLPNRNSVSNTLKIFKRNRHKSAFGFRNKLLGNTMINVFGEFGHPTRKLFQVAFSRFGAFALEPGFQGVEPFSGIGGLLAGMYFSITIYRQVLDTKIDKSPNLMGIICLPWRVTRDTLSSPFQERTL